MAKTKSAPAKKAGDPTLDGITLTNPGPGLLPGYRPHQARRRPILRDGRARSCCLTSCERPISLVRCPEGIDKEHFFQRHAMKGMSEAIKQVPISGGESKKPYLYIDDAEGLFGLVQIGVLEIHDWGVVAAKSTSPTASCSISTPTRSSTSPILKAAAVEVRDFLADLGFKSFLKATGGKGLHVVAPMNPKLGWDEVKAFAKAVADALVAARPDRYTANPLKKARARARSSSTICAISAAARPSSIIRPARQEGRAGGRAAPLGRAQRARSRGALHGQDLAGAPETR